MTWRTARSILVLQAQLKAATAAAPPATAVAEWGTVGDTAHSTVSDHSPHDFPGWGNDIVTAGDFPDRPDLGLDARRVLDDIRRSRDPRVKYGISHGQMFSSYPTSRYPAWTWRPYGGSDGHFTHGHLSVVGDARADGTQPWATIGADDMDLNAVGGIVPGLKNADVLKDIWVWAATARGLGGPDEQPRPDDRFASTPTFQHAVRQALADLQVTPAPVLTDEQLEVLADKVAGRLSGLRFIADPAAGASLQTADDPAA